MIITKKPILILIIIILLLTLLLTLGIFTPEGIKIIIIIIIRLPEKYAQLQTRQQRTKYKHIDKCTEWTSM